MPEISGLPVGATLDGADLLAVVDVSDTITSGAPTGTTKKYTLTQIASFIGSSSGIYAGSGSLSAATTVSMLNHALIFNPGAATGSNGQYQITADNGGALFSVNTAATAGNVGVSVGIASNDASSIFDISSTTKGFLPPRMTGAEVEAITSPATGLLAYATSAGGGDVTAAGYYQYNGANWVSVGGGGGADGNGIFTAGNSGLQVSSGFIADLAGVMTWQSNAATPGEMVIFRGTQGDNDPVKVTVKDDANIDGSSGFRAITDGGEIVLEGHMANAGNEAWIRKGNIRSNYADGLALIANTGTNPYIDFYQGGLAAANRIARFDTNGNFGINTTPAASTQVHISGAVGNAPLRVDTNSISNAFLVSSDGKISSESSSNLLADFVSGNTGTTAQSQFFTGLASAGAKVSIRAFSDTYAAESAFQGATMITNSAGADFYLCSARSSGATTPGEIVFGAYDATAQDLETRFAHFDSAGNFFIGTGANQSLFAQGGWWQISEGTAPSTPASGFGRIYAKTDGNLYFKNDAGTEFQLN